MSNVPPSAKSSPHPDPCLCPDHPAGQHLMSPVTVPAATLYSDQCFYFVFCAKELSVQVPPKVITR